MGPTSESAKYQALPTSEELVLANEEPDAEETVAALNPPSASVSVDIRIRWIYFLLGCAVLLPWNAMINATSFFTSRLANTPLQAMFSSYHSSVFTVTGLVFQAYCTVTSKQSSPSRRVLSSTVVLVFFVAFLFLSTYFQVEPSLFFSFVLFSAGCMAASGAYLQTSVLAGAALLGGAYMQSTMAGQAAIAVAVSVVELISSAVSVWGASSENIADFIANGGIREGKAEELAARIFFGVSVLFMAFTFMAYVWLTKQPLYKSTVGILERHRMAQDATEGDAEEHRGLASAGLSASPSSPGSDVLRVFMANFIFMFSVAYVFIITLAIYPTITVTVLPTNPNVHPLLFVAAHFLAFNAGDLLGRHICSFPRAIVWSARKILIMSLARTLFIPLVLLCNVQRPTATPPVPPVISSDVLYMVILIAIGMSNGYVSTLCFLAGSSLEHNHRLKGYQDVDTVATLTGFLVIVGLAVGSLFSFGVRAIICDCDPFRS